MSAFSGLRSWKMGQWVNGDLYNGRIVRVANSFIFKEPVFNYSADFPFLWDETHPARSAMVRTGSTREECWSKS